MRTHLRAITAFCTIDNVLLSASEDRHVKFWNETGQLIYDLGIKHGFGILCMAVTPNKKLILGTQDGTILIYDYHHLDADPQVIKNNQKTPVRAIAVFANNHWVTANQNIVTLWDENGVEQDALIYNEAIKIYSMIAIAQDSVALGLNNNTIRLYNFKSGSANTLSGHEGTVFSLAINNRTLASGSLDKTIKIWDLDKLEVKATLNKQNSSIYSLYFDPKLDLLISGSEDGRIVYWNIHDHQASTSYHVHSSPVEAVTTLGNSVVTGAMYGDMRLFPKPQPNAPTVNLQTILANSNNKEHEEANLSPHAVNNNQSSNRTAITK